MITEGGWNDHPRWTKAVRPAQRVAYSVAALRDGPRTSWPWVDAVCLWAFRYPRPARTYQDYYTFVDGDFRPKPIYEALQRYASGWIGGSGRETAHARRRGVSRQPEVNCGCGGSADRSACGW